MVERSLPVIAMSFLPFLLIAHSEALFLNFLTQFEDALDESFGTGRAARNIDIDRDNGIDALHGVITIVELAARIGATFPG